MSGKEKRRRVRKEKVRKARQSERGRQGTARMVGHLQRAASMLARYSPDGADPEDAAAAARSDLFDLGGRVVEAACGLDVITAVSSTHTVMAMQRSATGEDIPAAVLELIALLLMCRDSAGPSEPRRDQYLPDHLYGATRELLSVGSMIPIFEITDRSPESTIVFSSVQREVLLRNPVYPHMLLETLQGLFGDETVDADCREVLGFGGLDAVEVMNAAGELQRRGLEGLFDRMFAARDALTPYLRRYAPGRGDELPADGKRALQEQFDALTAITTNVADTTMIDADAIAQETGLPQTTVVQVLDAFTVRDVTDQAEVLDRFFHGDNPLRMAPIVADSQGRRMLVHEALALPAVREVIETRLKQAGRLLAYEHHRGTYVETVAVDLVAGCFPGATVFRAFNYFVPEPNAATPQQTPETFTKRVEGDGLILVDDVALIVEVKAVAMTAEARGGVARRLRGKLRDIITKAADQAGRLRERILVDKRIRLDDDEWIDVSGVREVHTIAVGLEDLSGVTTATFLLVAAGILSPDHIPWTVSVHDLRIVADVLERPSELLLYLRRRTQLEATWKFRAADEVDLLITYLSQGLYVERDPAEFAAEQPWAAPPSPAELRRFAQQWPELIEGQTDPLDAWYQSQIDPTATPVPKPQFGAVEPKLLELVEQLHGLGQPGWLATSTTLLEGDSKTRRGFGFNAIDIARRSRKDGKHHSVTVMISDSQRRRVLLVWAVPGRDQTADDLASHLLNYLRAKKYQTQADLAACMLFDRKTRKLSKLLYLNTPDNPPEELLLDRLQPLAKHYGPSRVAR